MTSTAEAVIADLKAVADPDDVTYVAKFYRGALPDTKVMGVRMPKVFPIAKAHRDMSLEDIETLLDDPHYEVRMAAMSIMDLQAQQKSLPAERRKALYDLYLRRHDRIDNWDLVDRAAPRVIGTYLLDRSRTPLDKLAKSKSPMARRTAIVATAAFIRTGDTVETFRIADMLAADENDYVQMAVTSWIREAGKKDPDRLVDFLTRHAGTLTSKAVRNASKHLSDEVKSSLRAAITGG